MTPETAKTVSGFLCHGLEHEFATTKKVLASLPDGKHDWRPHEKGMTAGELAWHIVSADLWLLDSVTKGNFDGFQKLPCPGTSAAIVEHYDKNFPPVLARIQAMSGEKLAEKINFK